MRKHRLKNDHFRRSRGGTARFLDLYCGKCRHHLLLYQKDGPGQLLRLYFDRIFDPPEVTEKLTAAGVAPPALRCLHCDQVVGTPMIYEREHRRAYLLRPGAVVKCRSTGLYPPGQQRQSQSQVQPES